jgi:hypothetical protein
MELVDMNSLGLFDFFDLIRSSRIYLILKKTQSISKSIPVL